MVDLWNGGFGDSLALRLVSFPLFAGLNALRKAYE